MSNRKKIIIVYVIVGIFAFIGLSGYVLNVKVFSKMNKEDIANEVTFKKIDNEDSRFYGIYKILNNYTYSSNRSNGYKSFTDKELISTISNYFVDSDFVVTKNIDKNTKNYYYNLSGSTIKNLLVNVFGSKVEFDSNSVLSNTDGYSVNTSYGNYMYLIKYDSNTDIYSCIFSNVNNKVNDNNYIRKITNVELEDDYITVYEKVIYFLNDGTNIKVYSDSSMTNLLDKLSGTSNINIDDYLDETTEIIQSYKYDTSTKNYYFDGSYLE